MKEFVYEHLILLNETNAMGGVVYFSNFVKWQGMAREYILQQHPKFKEIITRPIEMITHSCRVKYLGRLYYGDVVQIKITTKRVLPASFIMVFRYFNKATGQLMAEGEQKIVFANSETKEPCLVPPEILEMAKSVENES